MATGPSVKQPPVQLSQFQSGRQVSLAGTNCACEQIDWPSLGLAAATGLLMPTFVPKHKAWMSVMGALGVYVISNRWILPLVANMTGQAKPAVVAAPLDSGVTEPPNNVVQGPWAGDERPERQ